MANQMHQQQLNSALYALQRLLVNELKIVCREENLACSGIKNALQQRIRERKHLQSASLLHPLPPCFLTCLPPFLFIAISIHQSS